MKNLLKKLKENWLDYLIILISVFAICFVYLFTAFYQPKENEKNTNKENIVKVLRYKKNAPHDNFTSEESAFYIGTISPYNSNNTFVEFYLNINSFNYTIYYESVNNEIEFELEYYITAKAKYTYDVGMQTQATFNKTSLEYKYFSLYTQDINSSEEIEYIELNFNMKELEYEGGYIKEDVYFDIGLYFDVGITINDIKDAGHDAFYNDNYASFGIDATNLPINVRDQMNNNIFEAINDVHANTSVRDFKIYFNTNQSGYGSGYHEGFEDGHHEGYGEGLSYGEELGYNNGYNDGVIAGSNNFNILNLIRSLFDLVWSVLSVEMLPNIKLIYIVAIPLVLSVLKFILGWFR